MPSATCPYNSPGTPFLCKFCCLALADRVTAAVTEGERGMNAFKASVVSTSWKKGPVAKHSGIEILSRKSSATLRLHIYDRQPVAEMCGPSLRRVSGKPLKILNQAARELESTETNPPKGPVRPFLLLPGLMIVTIKYQITRQNCSLH